MATTIEAETMVNEEKIQSLYEVQNNRLNNDYCTKKKIWKYKKNPFLLLLNNSLPPTPPNSVTFQEIKKWYFRHLRILEKCPF